jgi:subtilisin
VDGMLSPASSRSARLGSALLVAIGLWGLGAPTAWAVPAGGAADYVVMLADGADAATVAAEHARQTNARVRSVYRGVGGYLASLTPQQLARIRSDPRVDLVDEDLPVEADAQVLPFGVDRVDADKSSGHAGSGRGKSVAATVAIVDTGIDLLHPDLNAVPGTNCVTPGSSPQDDNGHGTHVAGIVAARDDQAGVVGVAPGARVVAVKVLDSSGFGKRSQLICGIDWVTRNAAAFGIVAANMSLSGRGADDHNCGATNGDALHKAICRSIRRAGVTYVVSAGNHGADLAGFVPASYGEVLTATAMVDTDGARGGLGPPPDCQGGTDDKYAHFSNYASVGSGNEGHTIAAPGVCVLSTWPGGVTHELSGTSMAAPHVTGTVALCVASQACAGLQPAQIVAKLRADAAAKGRSYRFKGDPDHSPPPGGYYGFLVYAGGY